MNDLWISEVPAEWEAAEARYDEVVQRQKVSSLAELDRWCRMELPQVLSGRTPPFVTRDELVRATEWKMARGVWRARNLVLVKGNEPEAVIETSREALATIPHATSPISTLAQLAGVGPATASAIASAAAPESYPFFDELVAAQVPDLGAVAFTLAFYRRYAEALNNRARRLGADWTPARVERALWANSGGKAARSSG